jgi:hypothetical protein
MIATLPRGCLDGRPKGNEQPGNEQHGGWVTIPVGGLGGDDVEVLHDFVEESYRTIAPKQLIKELDAQREADPKGGGG